MSQPTQQITLPYDEPYSASTQGSTAGDTGFWPVAIDGREFLVDWRSGLYRRTSVDVLRTRQNQEPNESLLLEPEVWRTVVDSWHQGAGQTRRDREDSLPHRFYSSKNIDVWSQWGISLLPTTELQQAATSTMHLATARGALCVIDGRDVTIYRDHFNNVAFEETLGADPITVTSDGSSIYVGLVGGAVRRYVIDADLATYAGLVDSFATYAALLSGVSTYGDVINGLDAITPTTFVTLPADPQMLTYVKGFLLAGVNNVLYDISGGLATSAEIVFTHPLSNHRWVAGSDGLAAGYLLGGQGDKWFAFWITVADTADTMNPPVVAAPLPEGEIGKSLGSYLGYVLIGTDKGLRFAAPAGDNTLTYGRLIKTGGPVLSFEGQDRFVWFGIGGSVRDNEEALRQPEAGLGRLDLSTFTADLTPAFAADLIAVGEPVDRVTNVATFNDKRVFTVDRVGLFVESDSLADDGWLIDGIVTMGVLDRKTGLYAQMSSEPMVGSAYLDFGYDSQEYEPLVAIEAQGSTDSDNVSMGGHQFRALLPQVRLEKGTDGGPRVTRYEVRATPIIGAAHEWQVPLIIAETVNLDNVEVSRNPHSDLEYLIQLVENGRLFTFREGQVSTPCYSVGYEWRPESPSDNEYAFRGVFVLRIRDIR